MTGGGKTFNYPVLPASIFFGVLQKIKHGVNSHVCFGLSVSLKLIVSQNVRMSADNAAVVVVVLLRPTTRSHAGSKCVRTAYVYSDGSSGGARALPIRIL